MHYRMIGYVLGMLLVFEGLFFCVPILTAIVYGESAVWAFVAVAAICLALGGLMVWKKPTSTTLFARDGFVIAGLGWIVLSFFGALPFYISGEIPSFVDALFEAVSGFTTTGASVLSDVEALSNSMLMWRSFTHWVGGMGVLVFIMAFVPISGGQTMHIMKAESPGPSVSKLVPKVKTTAMVLYTLYLVLTLVMFVLLLFGGVNLFEALNIAFATAGTGGFAFKNSGMAEFNPYVQYVVSIGMLLFAINFGCYFMLLQKKWKEACNCELRTFLGIVAVTVTLICFNVRDQFATLEETFRHVLFTVASLISSTGFATVDYNVWPELSRTLLLMVMCIGACAGSTGGGFKVSRVIILFKSFRMELEQLIHPKQMKKVKMDGRPIEHEMVRSVSVYLVCFVLVFGVSMFVMAFDNLDLVTNFSAVLACLNNVGPGLEVAGPMSNYAVFSTPAKLVLIFDMLAGRLELFPILLLFTPSTWKR